MEALDLFMYTVAFTYLNFEYEPINNLYALVIFESQQVDTH
jgi:hypothetical protein